MPPGAASNYQAIYRACMKEAASQGRALMQRMIARAVEAMQERSIAAGDEMDRRLLLESARTLGKHEATLCDAYPQALLTEFAHAIAGDARKGGGVSFDSLERMGDEQVRENVDIMRMQQGVNAQVEAELAEINALISSVQGSKVVQGDRNPLRPDVYLRSLRTVAMQSPIPSDMRARWVSHLGEALGPELARVYTDLSVWMRAQGVAEARVASPPAAGAPAPADPKLLNLRELRKLVTGDFIDSGKEGRTAFGATLPAAVDALENMVQVDAVVERMKARQRADAQALAEGRKPDREPAQVLAQEVVRLMIDNIANDSRLLGPIQACVRDLERVFLRLALDDPRFFSDKQHPARRLLEELTQRSLAFESITSPGFTAFIEPLRQAVEVLRETRVPGAEPFDFTLKMLEDAWAAIQKRDRHHREKAVRALLNAEQRNLLAEKLAKGLRHRPDLQGAPKEIAAFVTGPWSQVIAQARLADTTGSHDPGGYTAILTDLIWSSQPAVVGAQTSRLIKLISPVVDKIRQGLATIDYPQASIDRFLDYLSQVHRLSLRGTAVDAHAEAPKLASEEVDAMMGVDSGLPRAWLAPEEAQVSGFVDTHSSITRETIPDTIPDVPVDQFQPGVWVEMKTAKGMERFQVTWASPHGTLFMFTGNDGQPHSMTRRLLAQMLEMDAMKVVSAQVLVDGALDAVVEEALRNSAA